MGYSKNGMTKHTPSVKAFSYLWHFLFILGPAVGTGHYGFGNNF